MHTFLLNKNFEIQTADSNLIVKAENQQFVFANSFTQDKVIAAKKAKLGNDEKEESFFTLELV